MQKKFKLSELGEFKNGANYPKDSYGKGDKIVNVKDLFTGRYVDEEGLQELKPNALNNKECYIVKHGDILFTRSSLVRSGAGMCAMINKPKQEILFCGFIIRYRLTNRHINPLYLLYLLRSPVYRKIFTGNQQTNITNINQDTLGNIEVYVPTDDKGEPDLNKQNQIVHILDKIDSMITNNINIINELETILKKIYNYWFIQYDFPNEQGKPYKSSGGKMILSKTLKKEIPKGWQEKTLDDIILRTNGYSFSSNDYTDNGKYKIYTIKNVQDGRIISKADNNIDFIPSNMERDCILHPGDIIMSLTGNVGRVGIVYEEALLNQRVLKLKERGVSKEFLYSLLRNDYTKIQLEKFASGTSQKNLSPIQLGNLNIVVPDNITMEKFNAKTSSISNLIVLKNKENEELVKIRDFLIPLLMNGKVKL